MLLLTLQGGGQMLVLQNSDIDAIAQQVLASAQLAPIAANIKQVNDTTVDGSGTSGDPWGPA